MSIWTSIIFNIITMIIRTDQIGDHFYGPSKPVRTKHHISHTLSGPVWPAIIIIAMGDHNADDDDAEIDWDQWTGGELMGLDGSPVQSPWLSAAPALTAALQASSVEEASQAPPPPPSSPPPPPPPPPAFTQL